VAYSSSKSGSKVYAESAYDSHPSSRLDYDYKTESAYDSHPSSRLDYDYKTESRASSTPKDVSHTSDVKSKPSKGKPRSPSPEDVYHSSDVKSKPSKGKSRSLSPQDPVPVYISDLPLDIDDDYQLAKHLRHRVEKTLRIELSDIKCYAKLGVGIMYVADNQTKVYLIDEVAALAWDPKDTKTMISFVKTLNLVSYIVLERPKEKTDLVLPTAEEISRRWADINHGQKPHTCEQLNTQFPNIYRLVSTSLDQLISSLRHEDFKVKNYFAQIYFCADCSFFEDVPRSITQDQLHNAVANAIKQPHISPSSLYVQLNKQASAACIIAANAARKWATISYVSINGKSISKKDKLACRLLIHPIPNEVSLQAITQHPDFDGKAALIKRSEDSLILDILDKNIFDDCIKRGALCVGGKYRLNMDAFTT
jgi:hypothetical protein